MKDNVIYINFSYQYKKKKFMAFIEKLFNKTPSKPAPKCKSKEIIKIGDFDKKRVL